jgi:hypothetical protein
LPGWVRAITSPSFTFKKSGCMALMQGCVSALQLHCFARAARHHPCCIQWRDAFRMAWHQHSLETVAMVAVPGGDIQYRYYRPHNDEAAARTPLLITHGGPGGSSIGLYDALHSIADQRPLICYDQLGSCCSPADLSADQMTLSRFAVEPLRLLDALELGTVHLLGHSWGGTVMAQFALRHPHRVSGLVLSSPLLSTARWLADATLLLAVLQTEGQAPGRRNSGPMVCWPMWICSPSSLRSSPPLCCSAVSTTQQHRTPWIRPGNALVPMPLWLCCLMPATRPTSTPIRPISMR